MTSSNLFRWVCAPEEAPGIDADLTIAIRNASSVAHQSAGRGSFAPWIRLTSPAPPKVCAAQETHLHSRSRSIFWARIDVHLRLNCLRVLAEKIK